MLNAHIIDYQKIWLEIPVENLVLAGEGLIMQKVTNQVEYRAIPNRQAVLDGLIAYGLDQMAFAHARRA